MMKINDKFVMPEMVYQDEINECGLACIAMLANMMGKSISLSDLRAHFSISAAGMSLEEIALALEKLNIRAFPVCYDPEHVIDLPFPAILHHGGNHFVLASEKRGKYAHVFNPATGDGVFLDSDLSERLTGFAIILDSNQDVSSTPDALEKDIRKCEKKFSISDVKIPDMNKIFIFSLLAMVGGLIIPAFFLMLLGPKETHDGIIEQAAIMDFFLPVVAAIIITAMVEIYVARLSIYTSSAVALRYIPEIFSNLLRKKYAFFENRALADINQRFASLSQAIAGRTSLINSIRVSIITCVSAVLVMFWVHFSLGILAVVIIACYGFISFFYSQQRTVLIRRLEEASSLRNEVVFESINGISTIKSAHMHQERCSKFAMYNMDVIRIGNQLAIMDAKQTVLYKLFSNFEALLLITISISLILRQELSVGGVFAFTLFKQIASGAATNFYFSCISYKEQHIADSRAEPMITYPEDACFSQDDKNMDTLKIEGVDFSYTQDVALYRELNFSLSKGEKIAIVGGSGCGKSSFLKLLSGLHSPDKGRVVVNGDLREWGTLNSLSFYLQQQDIIFNASVINNVTLFKDDADLGRATEVITQLGLDDCINKLPHGLKTMISEINPLMSSGQRQRLLVARALCTDKPLLMLDEPTANLDFRTAKQVMETILSCDKTVLVVLHDPELLAGFDRVITIQDGQLCS
ncbi:MAG: peptidase domain-containing ABC transporter [Aeromonadaceae bacterium]